MKENRIAIFCPSLRAGGAERVMVNLALGFAERGLTVDLVLAAAAGPFIDQVPRNVRVVDLRAKRVLAALPGLVRYLRVERPDTVVSAMNHANLTAILARALARVPLCLIATVHDTVSASASNYKDVGDRWMPGLIHRFYPWANAVVAVSRGAAEDMSRCARLPIENIQVIYNPVVGPELIAKAKEPIEHPWFAPGSPPVVLSVGRLTKSKDLPALIRAFAALRRKRPARLLILGEGEERSCLEDLVRSIGLQEDVQMPGLAANPYPYMAHAAVLALSSAYECLPTVLVEALAVGAPIVSTDCPSGGAREILEDGRWGRLVPVGSPESLADALSASLDVPRAVVPPEAVDRFTREAATDQYLRIRERWLRSGKP